MPFSASDLRMVDAQIAADLPVDFARDGLQFPLDVPVENLARADTANA